MTKKIYRSDVAAAMHQMVKGFERAGVVDRKTMRDFGDDCLVAPPTMPADEIRALREREAVSQPVFARYLNVSKNLISDWERGIKKPGGPALRLLTIIEKRGLQAVA